VLISQTSISTMLITLIPANKPKVPPKFFKLVILDNFIKINVLPKELNWLSNENFLSRTDLTIDFVGISTLTIAMWFFTKYWQIRSLVNFPKGWSCARPLKRNQSSWLLNVCLANLKILTNLQYCSGSSNWLDSKTVNMVNWQSLEQLQLSNISVLSILCLKQRLPTKSHTGKSGKIFSGRFQGI